MPPKQVAPPPNNEANSDSESETPGVVRALETHAQRIEDLVHADRVAANQTLERLLQDAQRQQQETTRELDNAVAAAVGRALAQGLHTGGPPAAPAPTPTQPPITSFGGFGPSRPKQTNRRVHDTPSTVCVPTAYRVGTATSTAAPFISLTVAGKEFAALLDSGASALLIEDEVLRNLQQKSVRVRHGETTFQLACGSTNSRGAVRLVVRWNQSMKRQRIAHLAGLTVLIILERDFLAHTGIIIDVASGGYREGAYAPLSSFGEHSMGATAAAIGKATEQERTDRDDTMPMSHPTPSSSEHCDGMGHPLAYAVGLSRPQRESLAKRKAIDAAVDELLKSGIIRRSSGPWGFPVVFVPKKNGTSRLCVDYRRLNAVTAKVAYPFPSIEEIIWNLGKAKYFTTLDASKGYLQVEMSPGDESKTAFVCHRGLFEFTRMTFGLTGAPTTFQRLIDGVLGDAKWQHALAYLDDIIVYSETFEDHLRHLEDVLRKLRIAGLTLNPTKSQIGASERSLMGFRIGRGKASPDADKLQAILEFPVPTDIGGVRRFLGMIGYYRAYTPNCAAMQAPLTQLLRKAAPWSWEAPQEGAFLQLTETLARTAPFKLRDLNRPLTIQTDASDQRLGAVLFQETEGEIRPVTFASRALNPAEKNYTSAASADYRGGAIPRETGNPASRFAPHRGGVAQLAETITSLGPAFNQKGLFEAQQSDSFFRVIFDRLRQEMDPDQTGEKTLRHSGKLRGPNAIAQESDIEAGELESYLKDRDSIQLRYFREESDSSESFKTVIPRDLRVAALRHYHDANSHGSAPKSWHKLRRFATWPGLKGQLCRYVRSCAVCQERKPRGADHPACSSLS
ncbi:reverse transcriptase/ribonuclease H [Ixodes scapularis]